MYDGYGLGFLFLGNTVNESDEHCVGQCSAVQSVSAVQSAQCSQLVSLLSMPCYASCQTKGRVVKSFRFALDGECSVPGGRCSETEQA